MNRKFLGGISHEEFIEKYWNKKTLVVKGAVSDIEDLSTNEDFFDMAFDENFESKLVSFENLTDKWTVKEGPLSEDDFNPKFKNTLTIHNLNLYFEEFQKLEKEVDFIQKWQFDDIMGVYSTKGGSLGPHIDNYNVFIIQGKGQRKWIINENPDPTYRDDLSIKVLKNFKTEIEYILNPGDMIFIPPGVAHHGVTLSDDCISYSIGLKSFDLDNLCFDFFREVVSIFESDKSLRASIPKKLDNPYELKKETIEEVRELFNKEILTDAFLADWFGRYITTPRGEIDKSEEISREEFFEKLDSFELFKDDFFRFTFFKESENKILLFANEKSFSLNKNQYQFFEDAFKGPSFEQINLDESFIDDDILKILLELVQDGVIFFDEESEQ